MIAVSFNRGGDRQGIGKRGRWSWVVLGKSGWWGPYRTKQRAMLTLARTRAYFARRGSWTWGDERPLVLGQVRRSPEGWEFALAGGWVTYHHDKARESVMRQIAARRNPRAVRKNLSWLELGSRIRDAEKLHPVLGRKVAAARKRGLKWQAYRMTEVDKYGNRKPAGQWLWIPKARIIGHLELPAFGTFIGGEKYAIQWSRAHPLARNLKEVWFQHQWGQEQYERAMRRKDPGYFPVSPTYGHWLEAREVAEREGRTIPTFDKWREQIGEEWHWTWYGGARRPRENAPRGWRTPKARWLARRIEKSLRRLFSYLVRLKREAFEGRILGWDTILDRTEAAIMRSCCPGMFKRELGEINGLRRRYEGYKMPTVTAVGPANGALHKLERALGMRRR